MKKALKEQWFLISLVFLFIAVIFDSSNILSTAGIFLKNHHGSEFIIFVIFIISGLMIENDQVKAGVKDVKATVLALILILAAAPLAALGLSVFPMETGVLAGLFIVASMPTTLSSGVVMTGMAGGNMAHALFVTILSNFIGIFSIPLILSALMSSLYYDRQLVIDQRAIIIKLFILVVCPLLTGMAVKNYLLKKNDTDMSGLQIINQFLVIGVVFISLAGAKNVLLSRGWIFFQVVLLAVGFHLLLLISSFVLIKLSDIERGRRESVIFMGSQKTLPLSVMIQVTYFSQFGTALLVLVVHHVLHLMIDGYLSTRMGKSN